jgi:hypothetical protein
VLHPKSPLDALAVCAPGSMEFGTVHEGRAPEPNVRGKASPTAERVRPGWDADKFGPAGPYVRSCWGSP